MFELDKQSYQIVLKKRVDNILQCNRVLENHGLMITEEQALELIQSQQMAVKDVGRIEFTNTIIEDIITTFSDSQFFTKYDFSNQLNELLEIFYYYREMTDGLLSDDDIIKYLYLSFEGPCQGSLSWLGDNQLNVLLDALHNEEDIFEGTKYGTY